MLLEGLEDLIINLIAVPPAMAMEEKGALFSVLVPVIVQILEALVVIPTGSTKAEIAVTEERAASLSHFLVVVVKLMGERVGFLIVTTPELASSATETEESAARYWYPVVLMGGTAGTSTMAMSFRHFGHVVMAAMAVPATEGLLTEETGVMAILRTIFAALMVAKEV
jgi:hypothetical protein